MAVRSRAKLTVAPPPPAPPVLPPTPVLVTARVQANVGDLRRGQIVEVWPDDPRIGHYLAVVDGPGVLLGVDTGPDTGAEPR